MTSRHPPPHLDKESLPHGVRVPTTVGGGDGDGEPTDGARTQPQSDRKGGASLDPEILRVCHAALHYVQIIVHFHCDTGLVGRERGEGEGGRGEGGGGFEHGEKVCHLKGHVKRNIMVQI